jgi:hypothetical protein
LEIVPSPGRSCSGHHASITSAPTSATTTPNGSPSCSDSPWWSTSHGMLPKSDRIISAMETP